MNYLDVYFMEELQKAIDSIVFELFNEDNERGYIKFRTSMMQDLTDFYISIIIGDKEYKENTDKFKCMHDSTDWKTGIDYAVELGLGSKTYELIFYHVQAIHLLPEQFFLL